MRTVSVAVLSAVGLSLASVNFAARAADPFLSVVPDQPPPKRPPPKPHVAQPRAVPAPVTEAAAPGKSLSPPAAGQSATQVAPGRRLTPPAAGAPASPVTNAAVASQAASNWRQSLAAAARSDSIPVPESIGVISPAANVQHDLARFSGAWGPCRWGSTAGGNSIILVVNRVDPAGNAQATLLESSGCNDLACSGRSPKVTSHVGKIDNDTLSYLTGNLGWRHSFKFDLIGWIQATTTNLTTGRSLTCALRHIE